jgi:sterol desaturase/sphingolipid hydroxylase (fatty acid hydroxylase superfamily)
MKKALPGWLTMPITAGAFLLLAYLERRRPLRRSLEPKLRREARNLAMAAMGAAAVALAEMPVSLAVANAGERRGWGLLKWVRLPGWIRLPAAVLLMDYTVYIWHILTHRVPFLWRFHLVHHVDLDMDASTALRFHFGELLGSVPWRAGEIAILGVSPLAYSIWQLFFVLSIMFHHSCVHIPVGIERRLNWFVVTPRMHGIHHSAVHAETDSNWSSGLTIWDRLHGTLRLNVPQRGIAIGVPAYRDPREVTLPKIVAMPFAGERPAWLLPGDGEATREEARTPRDVMLP